MTRWPMWGLLALVSVACAWWIYDNLAIGSSFVRFYFSPEWQQSPLTVIHLDDYLDYADVSEHIELVHDPYLELVERYGGVPIDVEVVTVPEMAITQDNWTHAILFRVSKGNYYSQLASSVDLRNFTSSTVTVVRNSVDVAMRKEILVDEQESLLVMLIEVRERRDVQVPIRTLTRITAGHASVVASERAIVIRGKHFFSPNLVMVFRFESLAAIRDWYRATTTQTELAILDKEVDRIHSIVLRSRSDLRSD